MTILNGGIRLIAVLFIVWGLCFLGQAPSIAVPDEIQNPVRKYQAERQAERLAQAYNLKFEWALFVVTASKEEAILQQLPHSLVLAVMAQESRFDPNAKSVSGAISLMQVVPRWHQEKLGEAESLWNPRVNMRVGTQVLREYLDRRRSIRDALQQYNGNRSDVTYRYSRKVEKHRELIEAIL